MSAYVQESLFFSRIHRNTAHTFGITYGHYVQCMSLIVSVDAGVFSRLLPTGSRNLLQSSGDTWWAFPRQICSGREQGRVTGQVMGRPSVSGPCSTGK